MKLETEKLTLAPNEAPAVTETTHRVSLLQLNRLAAAALTTHSLRISNRAIRDRDGKAVNTSRFNDRTG